MKIIRRVLAQLLIIALVTLIMTELILQTVDPLGLKYVDDLATFYSYALPTEYGFRVPPGTYPVSNWSFTIAADGARYTPASETAQSRQRGQRVLFVGDSVTFGWGMNDDQTWINHIAQQLGIEAVNAGMPGFNATQILEVVRSYPDEEHIVYLSFHNDNQVETMLQPPQPRTLRLVRLYNLLTQPPIPESDPAFSASMQTLSEDDRILILAFDDHYGRQVSQNYGAVLIPPYTTVISVADQHADAAGNQQIADGALTPISAFLEARQVTSQ